MALTTILAFAPPKQGVEQPLITSKVPLVDCSARALTAEQQQQALEFIWLWQQSEISRYNRWHQMPELPGQFVLLIWQDNLPESLQQHLLQHAIQLAVKQPCSAVLICHEHHRQIKLSRQCQALLTCTPQVQVQLDIAQLHHASLLAKATQVLCADSWLGFEALMWRKPVIALLPSFYAVLTEQVNVLSAAARSIEVQPKIRPYIEQWVWQIFLQDATWFNYEVVPPSTELNMKAALAWLRLQRQCRQRFAHDIYAIGFNLHWRHILQQFIQGSRIHFVSKPEQVPADSQAVIWGRTDISARLQPSVQLLRLEDGFLRSVGLGIQFSQPLSWVVDQRGLYFDATSESDLEVLLSEHPLGAELQQRAEALIQRLVQQQISKYNTGITQWCRPDTTKKVHLVVGQVESDASIAYGAGQINTNLTLLQQVRIAEPAAFIIYKPHPDVVAGARALGLDEQRCKDFCDLVLTDINITAVLPQVDAVHVMTSLAGFEALLRGKTVHCYGLPFYAGWGLTQDHVVCARRQRSLSLSQLVAATLLLYPLYVSKQSGYYCSAEQTLEQLSVWRAQPQRWSQKIGVLARAMMNRFLGVK